ACQPALARSRSPSGAMDRPPPPRHSSGRGGGPIGPRAPLLNALGPLVANPTSLTDAEVDDLVAFVRDGLLTSSRRARGLRNPPQRGDPCSSSSSDLDQAQLAQERLVVPVVGFVRDLTIREPRHVYIVEDERFASGRDVAGGRGEWTGVRSGGTRLEHAGVGLLDDAADLVFDIRKGSYEHAVPGHDLINAAQLRTWRIDLRGRAV